LCSKIPLRQQHQADYLALLDAVKGNFKEKRLAIQFITKFNKHFPELIEKTIESQFDLCEAEESMVIANTHKQCLTSQEFY
jgi:Apoptosis inhibitory protein 5 (API5)